MSICVFVCHFVCVIMYLDVCLSASMLLCVDFLLFVRVSLYLSLLLYVIQHGESYHTGHEYVLE